jgi:hypothetical protein
MTLVSAKCKHDIDRRFCAFCREAVEREPLQAAPLMITESGQAVLVVRHFENGVVRVINPVLTPALVETSSACLRPFPDSKSNMDAREVLLRVVLDEGYLFIPKQPLTFRERFDDVGPPHCYYCKTVLALDSGTLGCTRCRYYVCGCGRCLCGYTGTNWQGQLFSQCPALPIPREDRLEYVRAFRYLRPPSRADRPS